jgi:hypothetical protein
VKKEKLKEPCRDLIIKSLRVPLGSGSKKPMLPEPEVHQQIRYGVGFRLTKGFSILKGGDI